MSHDTEDLSIYGLDAFNNVPSLSSGSGETTFEGLLDTSTPRESLAAPPFPAPECTSTAFDALSAPSDNHALGENQGLERPSHDNDEPSPPPYSLEWEREIASRGNGEGPSNFGNGREVSKWSSSTESTPADPSNSILPVESEEPTEALASSLQISPGGPPEFMIPEPRTATPRPKKVRGVRIQVAKVRARYFWRRAKALQKRAATFLGDVAFYGIFDRPARDPLYANAEVIDGISVTESELREYQAMLNSPRPSPPSYVSSAPVPEIPTSQEQEPEPQGERTSRSVMSTKARKFGRRIVTAMKKLIKK